MKSCSHPKHQFELFPASLLVKRRLWAHMTEALPANSCLLILQQANVMQGQLGQRLGRAFQAQGRRVFVLKVD